MKKYLPNCLILCLLPSSALASLGSGFYLSAGVGGGWLDAATVTDFTLDYPFVYATVPDPDELSEDIIDNFENTATYGSSSANVIAGRAAIGYLWPIFDGEPQKFANAIYTVNATLGLEFGYRLFETVNKSTTIVEMDSINVPPGGPSLLPYEVFETAAVKTRNSAFDVLAVARFPFTEDNALALLLKGGVAYNIYKQEVTKLTIEANLEVPIEDYNRTIDLAQKQDFDEFLPSVGAGLEYMFYSHVGVSVEYNALLGSKHHADSQLLTGNIILRM